LEKFSKIQSQITVDKGLSLAEEFGGTFERLSDSGGQDHVRSCDNIGWHRGLLAWLSTAADY
jgi:hypothetical protein